MQVKMCNTYKKTKHIFNTGNLARSRCNRQLCFALSNSNSKPNLAASSKILLQGIIQILDASRWKILNRFPNVRTFHTKDLCPYSDCEPGARRSAFSNAAISHVLQWQQKPKSWNYLRKHVTSGYYGLRILCDHNCALYHRRLADVLQTRAIDEWLYCR